MEEKQVKIRGGLHMSEKRNDYITWDEYFMGVAKLSAMRSKRSEHAGGGLYRQR